MATNGYTTTPESLSEETIQQYRKDGFVSIQGIISKEEAARFRQAALDAQKHFKSLTGGERSRIFTQLVNVWTDDEEMSVLTLHPNVAAVAEKLAGVPLRLWHDHILIKQPHNNAPTEFHQDQPYWPHVNSTHALSAWIALVDVPVEKGCMTFIPGSQAMTELPSQDLSDEHDLMRKSPELIWKPRVTVPLQAGDCTFHHARTAHMATSNFTDDPRVAHIVIYIDASTVYTGKAHVVSDPVGLEPGKLLEGKYFPTVEEIIAR
jgi:ectoine hydroxylase-related dioxygenase (phytanoyl-CoA dioxygenase family)